MRKGWFEPIETGGITRYYLALLATGNDPSAAMRIVAEKDRTRWVCFFDAMNAYRQYQFDAELLHAALERLNKEYVSRVLYLSAYEAEAVGKYITDFVHKHGMTPDEAVERLNNLNENKDQRWKV